jgi:hypothetical protein
MPRAEIRHLNSTVDARERSRPLQTKAHADGPNAGARVTKAAKCACPVCRWSIAERCTGKAAGAWTCA